MKDYFQIYDLNFNPIPLPTDELGYGLRGLDLVVSSVGEEVTEHALSKVPGYIQTGFTDRDREMSIHARLKAKDAIDFRLKRDRVFSFFKQLGTFYVTEVQQGNKLMKVRVSESYTFERPQGNRTFSTAIIPLKIVGQPYWISRFKTMDLHNAGGVPFDGGWSYGMGLDVNKTTYQYENVGKFNIYNAGRPLKTIQEQDCYITIDVNQTVTDFRLFDSTGRWFEYNPMKDGDWSLKAGDKIVLNGHYMKLNDTPIMERTNRYFIRMLSGDNQFTMQGLNNYKITFDFRFKYD